MIPRIKAWPWVENTPSWVEPTAYTLLALTLAGHAHHRRVQEAIEFLMDRQLARGGWNYGSTVVYGQDLYPQPGTTGIALSALGGLTDRSKVEASLDYVHEASERLRTPFSLGWAIMGLSTWGERPLESRAWTSESLGLQHEYGIDYGTSLLSLLILASLSERGLPGFLADGEKTS